MACEIDWLCTLLHSLDIVVDYAVVLYCDNMSSIKLSSNPVFHARTKHIVTKSLGIEKFQ